MTDLIGEEFFAWSLTKQFPVIHKTEKKRVIMILLCFYKSTRHFAKIHLKIHF